MIWCHVDTCLIGISLPRIHNSIRHVVYLANTLSNSSPRRSHPNSGHLPRDVVRSSSFSCINCCVLPVPGHFPNKQTGCDISHIKKQCFLGPESPESRSRVLSSCRPLSLCPYTGQMQVRWVTTWVKPSRGLLFTQSAIRMLGAHTTSQTPHVPTRSPEICKALRSAPSSSRCLLRSLPSSHSKLLSMAPTHRMSSSRGAFALADPCALPPYRCSKFQLTTWLCMNSPPGSTPQPTIPLSLSHTWHYVVILFTYCITYYIILLQYCII